MTLKIPKTEGLLVRKAVFIFRQRQESSMSQFKKIICVDFDGVLHSYESGYQGIDVIPDPPNPGAIEWLAEMLLNEDLEIAIFSSRSKEPEGIVAMKKWILLNFIERGFFEKLVYNLKFPRQKPVAWLTIDDRAICFDGNFPDYDTIKNFKPWYKK